MLREGKRVQGKAGTEARSGSGVAGGLRLGWVTANPKAEGVLGVGNPYPYPSPSLEVICG